MKISEKAAYLKGLADGMNLDPEGNKKDRLLTSMIDILGEVAQELEDLSDNQAILEEGLDAISDDLEDVEDMVYDDDWDLDDEEEEEECYAITCPNCEETIYFDEDVLDDGEILCPNCGQRLSFSLDSPELLEEEKEEEDIPEE